jgi:hypothetical protein
MKEKLQASWEPIEFVVKEIYLISRCKDDPFEIRHVVPFAWDETRGSTAPPHFATRPIPEKTCVNFIFITITIIVTFIFISPTYRFSMAAAPRCRRPT